MDAKFESVVSVLGDAKTLLDLEGDGIVLEVRDVIVVVAPKVNRPSKTDKTMLIASVQGGHLDSGPVLGLNFYTALSDEEKAAAALRKQIADMEAQLAALKAGKPIAEAIKATAAPAKKEFVSKAARCYACNSRATVIRTDGRCACDKHAGAKFAPLLNTK